MKKSNLEKITPITPNHIQEFNLEYLKLTSLEERIVDRANYVVRKTIELLRGEIDWWDWTNGGGEVDGSLTPEMLDGDYFEVEGNLTRGGSENMEILYENEVWDFSTCIFPTKFLYEDFEDAVVEGRKLFVEKKRAKQEKAKLSRELKKKEKEELKKSALQKLTKEELKALGV